MAAGTELKILVVGSGGREHAICWKLSESPRVQKIWCAPGNGGTARGNKTENVDLAVSDFDGIGKFALANKVDLVVIGPDNPLADGIVDQLEALKLRVFGPCQAAAQLEASKAFAKDFMRGEGIPTARFFTTESWDEAKEFVAANNWARVIKADGLALGKGVFVTDNDSEAEEALAAIFQEKRFGEAGTRVVIEERLWGEELSVLMFCDGKTLELMPICQDHKRRFENDKGPNTGGMGAFSPVALWDKCHDKIESEVIAPLKQALASGRLQYQGVLYAGILVCENLDDSYSPYVLEFNARFGDPETQVILPLLENDLAEILWACTEGTLSSHKPRWKQQAACCVVACGDAYPESSSKGHEITIDQIPADSHVFHAGTKVSNDKLLTNGGRVLAVTACARDLSAAVDKAYEALNSVHFADKAFRKDIARRSLSGCR